MMEFALWLSKKGADFSPRAIDAIRKLKDEGATVPFIARYRKEATGGLDEVGVQALFDLLDAHKEFTERQAFILKTIEAQGQLTPELKAKIDGCWREELLEDLYLPYKKKKKSKATAAKEAGFEPLALELWAEAHGEKPVVATALAERVQPLVKAEEPYNTPQAVIDGISYILVEKLSEISSLREQVREELFKNGVIRAQKGEKAKENSKFDKYFDYREKVGQLERVTASHRYLALRRGLNQQELSVSLEANSERLEGLYAQAAVSKGVAVPQELSALLLDAAKRAVREHVQPSIEREVHTQLRETAEAAAIQVFSENLKRIFMAAPLGPKAVLGIDPGLRTGCKLAVVDEAGAFKESAVIFPDHDPKKAEAGAVMLALLHKHNVQAIAIGNGTGGREVELFTRDLFKEVKLRLPIVMISEAGASVYSASEVAREEFADLDLTLRGAISIARRLQDPLSELVKVPPKSLGVGQYQHDVNQNKLGKKLGEVVDSCVHAVGVDLNTASHTLLAHVSGIGETLAKNIVQHRQEKGLFKERAQLLDVPHFGTKAYELAAGFLRVRNGKNPLDNTGVHPEVYEAIKESLTAASAELEQFMGENADKLMELPGFKDKLGEFTAQDVVKELKKPGRDPRDNFVIFQFREDIRELKDLKPGMTCPGLVTNVTNFGAFVDIGVHQDGLVHLSELSDQFVKDPHDVVKPGDAVVVKVLNADLAKKQIALTMRTKSLEERKAEAEAAQQHRQRRQQHAERKQQADEARKKYEDELKQWEAKQAENRKKYDERVSETREAQQKAAARPAGREKMIVQTTRDGNGGAIRMPVRVREDRPPRDFDKRFDGPRGPRRDHGGGGGGGSKGAQKPLTENPFAALAALKEQMKK